MRVKEGIFIFSMTVSTMAIAQTVKPTVTDAALAHTSNTFRFEVRAPMARVAPLFAPEAERSWAGQDWNPVFLHPQPGKDVQGAVFTVMHGPHSSVWVNTLLDVPGGRMQYVSFVPDALVTTVDVRVTSAGESRTAVEVSYSRTALQSGLNDHVRELGNSDRYSGPHWREAIETYLSVKRE